jgi:hypothetical protein
MSSELPSKREIEDFLRRKYVVRRNRGIDYMEAGVDDLAKEFWNFIQSWRAK